MVQQAQLLAQEKNHPHIDTVHMFLAMIEEKNSYIRTIINKTQTMKEVFG